MYVAVTIQATFRETRYDHGIDIKVEATDLTVEFLSNAKAVALTENNDSKLGTSFRGPSKSIASGIRENTPLINIYSTCISVRRLHLKRRERIAKNRRKNRAVSGRTTAKTFQLDRHCVYTDELEQPAPVVDSIVRSGSCLTRTRFKYLFHLLVSSTRFVATATYPLQNGVAARVWYIELEQP